MRMFETEIKSADATDQPYEIDVCSCVTPPCVELTVVQNRKFQYLMLRLEDARNLRDALDQALEVLK